MQDYQFSSRSRILEPRALNSISIASETNPAFLDLFILSIWPQIFIFPFSEVTMLEFNYPLTCLVNDWMIEPLSLIWLLNDKHSHGLTDRFWPVEMGAAEGPVHPAGWSAACPPGSVSGTGPWPSAVPHCSDSQSTGWQGTRTPTKHIRCNIVTTNKRLFCQVSNVFALLSISFHIPPKQIPHHIFLWSSVGKFEQDQAETH